MFRPWRHIADLHALAERLGMNFRDLMKRMEREPDVIDSENVYTFYGPLPMDWQLPSGNTVIEATPEELLQIGHRLTSFAHAVQARTVADCVVHLRKLGPSRYRVVMNAKVIGEIERSESSWTASSQDGKCGGGYKTRKEAAERLVQNQAETFAPKRIRWGELGDTN